MCVCVCVCVCVCSCAKTKKTVFAETKLQVSEKCCHSVYSVIDVCKQFLLCVCVCMYKEGRSS